MLKQIVENINSVNEADILEDQELSPLQKEYRAYFTNLLDKYGVKSPAEMDEETMKKFFNEVTNGWIKGKGAKK